MEFAANASVSSRNNDLALLRLQEALADARERGALTMRLDRDFVEAILGDVPSTLPRPQPTLPGPLELADRLGLSFTFTPSHATMSGLGNSNHIHDAGRAVRNVDVDSPQNQTVFLQTEDAYQLMAIENDPLNNDGDRDMPMDGVDAEAESEDENSHHVVHSPPDCGLCAIIPVLDEIFRDKVKYHKFVLCRGDTARRLLDVLQSLLDDKSHLTLYTRRRFMTALRRLSIDSRLYPTCFIVSGVELGKLFATNGAFSDVYDGSFRGQKVVIKKTRQMGEGVDDLVEMFSREAVIWRQLSHPNVLPFIGLCTINEKLSLLSPLMENGQLDHFLRTKQCSHDERLSFILDVALGLRYLHQQEIVHGDLKQPNILVTPFHTACIADFGVASVLINSSSVKYTRSSQRGRGGTLWYQAPEILDGGPNSFKSDVYAFACIAYEILTGDNLFPRLSKPGQVITCVLRGERPLRPNHEDIDGLWELLEECWDPRRKPKDRPTAVKVVEKLLSPTILTTRHKSHPWPEASTSKFHCSQSEDILPTVDEIQRLIFGDDMGLCPFEAAVEPLGRKVDYDGLLPLVSSAV